MVTQDFENGGSENPTQVVRPQRMLKLASLLEDGRVWSVRQLAAYFRVSKRTIMRDLQLLRQAQVPVVFNEVAEGYQIAREGVGLIYAMKADELVALVLAIKFVGALPESIAAPCDRALAKILSAALPAVREQAIDILDRYEPDPSAELPRDWLRLSPPPALPAPPGPEPFYAAGGDGAQEPLPLMAESADHRTELLSNF